MTQKHKGDKRDRFELLMQQAELPSDLIDSFFSDGYIERVECSQTNKQWTFIIKKEQIFPSDAYRVFCNRIKNKFQHIAQIEIVFEFSDQVSTEQIIEQFWSLCIEWIGHRAVSINGWMNRAKVEVTDDVCTLIMANETALELAQTKKMDEWIQQFFTQYFSRTFQINWSVSEDSAEEMQRFAELIEQENRAFSQDLIASIAKEEAKQTVPTASKLMFGYEIYDEPVSLQQITEEEKKITVQGTVFNLEHKELKNGSSLFLFGITDFSDSIQAKIFARSKEDIATLSLLKNGKWIRARGRVEHDRFSQDQELTLIPNDVNEVNSPPERMDEAETKRVEFHLHTSMSAMDSVTSIEKYIATAAKWGHEAIAITDHNGVQAFPEANRVAKKHGVKVIYGVEANLVNDDVSIVINGTDNRPLTGTTYVVFDVETTGLSVTQNKIIEIAGVKMIDGKEVERYSSFINPHEKIPYQITQLTNITDDMVRDAPEEKQVISEFLEFIEGSVLVAHNAKFDEGFLKAACERHGFPEFDNPILDTLEFARLLYPTMRNHRLNTLADKWKISLDNHHRAIDDSIALGHILFYLIKDAEEINITQLVQLNEHAGKNLKTVRPFHSCIYALNDHGRKNLYKLISLSHTEYFNRQPTIPKSVLMQYREGLIVASGCEKGEFFEAVLNKSVEEAEEIATFYDVLEIQPICVNMHLVERGFVGSTAQLELANRKVVQIGHKLNIPVIATGNVHYLHPRDKVYRDITIHGITGFSPLKDLNKPDVHFRTTDEMIEEFLYLGEEIAYQVVVENTVKLAQQFEHIQLFPKQLFTPELEGADEEIRNTCYETAKQLYGESLPEVVIERLEKELVPIIKYGFSANYLISERLVKKSNEDGYLVGSRGSVGSSVVATFLGISEVNPLPPHYRCPSCKHSEWILDGSLPSGFDLPQKSCPECDTKLIGDGQDIPFETFLGFKGDKVPDIDLNFSGEYQPVAHNFTKEMFGESYVFRAGTIGTVAEKTAYGFVKKYEEDRSKKWRGAEIARLASGCTGVKRNTGQHPGGIVVVPNNMEIEDITPVQFPADDTSSEWKTTHFDYHAFDDNLLKLDILGHDDPTMMRMLQDLTGVDPTSIPMNDPKVMSVFSKTDAIGVTEEEIRSPVATFGVPEMGTKFVRQMLKETEPKSFADLLQISGLSHGTGVWLGNAQELIKNGTCTIKTVIGCRDDIMLYLIYKANMDASLAFTITESVRRGRGLTDEWIQTMKEHNVPQWYIDSCQRIEYMFPKAHAAAYVISAVRTAYFKVYYPIEYYATYFTVRAEDVDIELFCQGYDAIKARLIEIEEKGFQATPKERSMISILEMGLEMTARGFGFKPIDLYRSEGSSYLVDGEYLIPPFSALQGIGEAAAHNIAASREAGDYLSIEDFRQRSKASKTIVELLQQMGCFRGLPESNQLSLF